MDGAASDDPTSQYVHLGSVFFAIAIVVWTSVAAWLCYSGPPGCDTADPDGDGLAADGTGDLADSVIGRVAHGFAELLLDKASSGAQCDGRTLDLSKLEELLAPPTKGDCKGAGSKALLAKVKGSVMVKDAAGQLSPPLTGLNLGKDGGEKAGGGDSRSLPAVSRTPPDAEGRNSSRGGPLEDSGGPSASSAADLAAFREQLREKIASSLSNGAGRKAAEDLPPLAGEATHDRSERGGLRDVKQDFVKQLLHHPSFGGLRGKLAEAVEADDKDGSSRPATALSMAEHAREIGNKYLQDRHFAAAAHCYEVACLLCPAGGGGPGQLAAYHCNCALACLELGRYGDAVNEGNAALVLNPPKHLAVKALYRLAVAHANLRNSYEARRCLKSCLDLDPLNEYARVFLTRLGEEDKALPEDLDPPGPSRLAWLDPPKRVQCLGPAAREKAKGKRSKQRTGLSSADEMLRLDREAGLWHTVTRHNNKLYILGGWPDGPAGGLPSETKVLSGGKDGSLGGSGLEAVRGCDELHVLDVDSFELRQLSGPNSKPPHQCCCHTATMVGSCMYVFGGLGPPLDQPPLVMIFDVLQGKWRVPQTSGIPPRQRQGHTANAVQADRHLCIFGGLEPTGEQRTARVYGDAHLLDLQSFAWRKLDMGGRRPPARFGHTATNLPGSSGRLLIVGGRDQLHGVRGDPLLSNGFMGLHILDTERRTWAQQPFTGAPPLQAFYHSACTLDDQTILFLASGAGASSQGSDEVLPLHLLDLESWRWSQPRAPGAGPSPRVGHAAVAAGGRVYLFGGLVRRGGQSMVDKAMYVLDTTAPQRAAETEVTSVSKEKEKEKAKGEKARSDAKVAAAVDKAETAQPPPTVAVATPPVCVHTPPAATVSPTQGVATGPPAAQVASGITAVTVPAQPKQQSQIPPSSSPVQQRAVSPAAVAEGGAACGEEDTVAPAGAAAGSSSRDERIEMMLRESGFDECMDDATEELSFEELLEQEKAFFKAQSEKLSFPRPKDAGPTGKTRNNRF